MSAYIYVYTYMYNLLRFINYFKHHLYPWWIVYPASLVFQCFDQRCHRCYEPVRALLNCCSNHISPESNEQILCEKIWEESGKLAAVHITMDIFIDKYGWVTGINYKKGVWRHTERVYRRKIRWRCKNVVRRLRMYDLQQVASLPYRWRRLQSSRYWSQIRMRHEGRCWLVVSCEKSSDAWNINIYIFIRTDVRLDASLDFR